ncbi:MAG: hypothetical protein RI567_09220 [Marinobacter sp.]|nr:hypothetical protein [Marinobacter sp.]
MPSAITESCKLFGALQIVNINDLGQSATKLMQEAQNSIRHLEEQAGDVAGLVDRLKSLNEE